MKTLHYTFPVGASIHIRGVAGLVLALDRPEGNRSQIILDPANSVPGNIKMVEYAGRIDDGVSSERYYEMQVFAAQDLPVVDRVITRNSLQDKQGKTVRAPKSSPKPYELGLEYELQSVLPGPNIWLGWMVGNLGQQTIEVLADGKVTKSRKIEARAIPEERFANLRSPSELVFTIHTDNPGRRTEDPITIGDVVSFGFTLQDLQAVSDLEIRVR